MTDLRLEREFKVPPERLFEVVSNQSELLQWWGPETMFVSDHNLDLSRTGPWFATIQNQDGQRFTMSGQVTHVDPPKSVGFTWGWHDENNQRGIESHVTFTVVNTASGSRLILDHRDLSDTEQSLSHESGWTSALKKLANFVN
jgi:uncharacterized protein YndB with AHSA1/START domain